jgi:hypothetical protein
MGGTDARIFRELPTPTHSLINASSPKSALTRIELQFATQQFEIATMQSNAMCVADATHTMQCLLMPFDKLAVCLRFLRSHEFRNNRDLARPVDGNTMARRRVENFHRHLRPMRRELIGRTPPKRPPPGLPGPSPLECEVADRRARPCAKVTELVYGELHAFGSETLLRRRAATLSAIAVDQYRVPPRSETGARRTRASDLSFSAQPTSTTRVRDASRVLRVVSSAAAPCGCQMRTT